MQVSFTGLDNVIANLKRCGTHTVANVVSESQRTAAELENHSKNVRPWTDRTGNARRSIYAFSDINSQTIKIYHGIGVDYGVYLELSNGGKYRVIGPSVNMYRTIWLNNLKNTLRA